MLACASAGDPPGGAPDQMAPAVLAVEPESGAVLTAVPDEARIHFDEVISENTAAQPNTIAGAIILSPVSGEIRVGWHRDHISVKPRGGFQPGRIYHLELLPVISDLRNNRLRSGRLIVFSTGPEIPHAELRGAVVEWLGARPAARGLIEALLVSDSLVYRALADSGGMFRIGDLPPGRYLVRGGVDTNNDRRLGGREAYDTVSVTVSADTATVTELFAFPHDTTAPGLRQVEQVDSLTIKLTFTQPLADNAVLDTSAVTVATAEDSTTRLPLAGVFTQKMLDSLVRRAGDSAAAARAAADSARRAADTSAAARAQPPAQRPAAPAAAPAGRPGLRPAAAAPLDSTLAQRMLARRPAPSDSRLVRMAAPLIPDTRYVIYVEGVSNLLGVTASRRSMLRVQRPRRTQTTPGDSTRAARDSTGAVRPDSAAAPRDTLQPRPAPSPAAPTRP